MRSRANGSVGRLSATAMCSPSMCDSLDSPDRPYPNRPDHWITGPTRCPVVPWLAPGGASGRRRRDPDHLEADVAEDARQVADQLGVLLLGLGGELVPRHEVGV